MNPRNCFKCFFCAVARGNSDILLNAETKNLMSCMNSLLSWIHNCMTVLLVHVTLYVISKISQNAIFYIVLSDEERDRQQRQATRSVIKHKSHLTMNMVVVTTRQLRRLCIQLRWWRFRALERNSI